MDLTSEDTKIPSLIRIMNSAKIYPTPCPIKCHTTNNNLAVFTARLLPVSVIFFGR